MTHTEQKSQSPLTFSDKSIIAAIVNQSEYPHFCNPDDVETIWINEGVVWTKLSFGCLPFHYQQFKKAVAVSKEKEDAPEKERPSAHRGSGRKLVTTV